LLNPERAMQHSAATPTQTAAPFFSSFFGGGGGTSNNSESKAERNAPSSPTGKSQRPTTSGEDVAGGSPKQTVLQKDQKPSFGRKASFFSTSPGKRKASNTGPPVDGYWAAVAGNARRPSDTLQFSDNTALQLPDPSPRTGDGRSKMLSRGAVTPVSGYPVGMSVSSSMLGGGSGGTQQNEMGVVHQHIQETANKRISTLEYLRKA
jgi:hypothetical protein